MEQTSSNQSPRGAAHRVRALRAAAAAAEPAQVYKDHLLQPRDGAHDGYTRFLGPGVRPRRHLWLLQERACPEGPRNVLEQPARPPVCVHSAHKM
jgi:hypothetical protein